MTQIFNQTGDCIPVTVLEAGPNVVLQKKTVETDGYVALQVGYGDRRPSRTSKAALGHFQKAGVAPKRLVREPDVCRRRRFGRRRPSAPRFFRDSGSMWWSSRARHAGRRERHNTISSAAPMAPEAHRHQFDRRGFLSGPRDQGWHARHMGNALSALSEDRHRWRSQLLFIAARWSPSRPRVSASVRARDSGSAVPLFNPLAWQPQTAGLRSAVRRAPASDGRSRPGYPPRAGCWRPDRQSTSPPVPVRAVLAPMQGEQGEDEKQVNG
jgi:hypothetical protein